jgi:hypothetical protein
MNQLTHNIIDNSLVLYINGKNIDSHNVPSNEKELLDKLASMTIRHLGNDAYFAKTEIPGLIKHIIKRYFSIDGEDRYKEYFRHLNYQDPTSNWNGAMARMTAYSLSEKLKEAGFQDGFAVITAYNHMLIEHNPDRHEIYKVLGISKIQDN